MKFIGVAETYTLVFKHTHQAKSRAMHVFDVFERKHEFREGEIVYNVCKIDCNVHRLPVNVTTNKL